MNATAWSTLRDTVPRVQHVTYLQVLLEGISQGRSFDSLRADLRKAAVDLSRRVGGRAIAARVDDLYTYWSPTSEALGELMRLGLVERQPVPSKRDNVDNHRQTTYSLTPAGAVLEKEARGRESKFRAEIAPLLVSRHPYFEAVLSLLSQGPLVIPEYTEEDLRQLRDSSGLWIPHLGAHAAQRVEQHVAQASVDPTLVTQRLNEGLARRFAGTSPAPKAILDTVQDLLVASTLEACGLRIDAITFNILVSWGRHLYLLDESRHVAGLQGRVIWSTARVSSGDEGVLIEWHGLAEFGELVTTELVKAYRELADTKAGPGLFPYLPIYEVRALTAFRVGVVDQVVDRIIAELADRSRSANVRVELALGAGGWQATSERPFRVGERRFYVMLVKPEAPPEGGVAQ